MELTIQEVTYYNDLVKNNKALKIAGQVQSDVKEKNSKVTHENLVELATKQLKDNKSKYQKMVV